MSISGVAGLSGLSNYRISSINGNPYSMNAVQRIGQDGGRSGKPLVIASEKPEEELYVKDYGELDAPKSTATGGFAEMLSMQEDLLTKKDTQPKQSYSSYLNDTIGMMGYQNRLRDQLGVGAVSF